MVCDGQKQGVGVPAAWTNPLPNGRVSALGSRDGGVARMGFDEVLGFLVTEHSRFRDEPQAERDLKRKACTAALDDIDRQLGMLPEFELVLRHVKIAGSDLAKPDVTGTNQKLTLRITHWRRPVAAPAGLMEH